MVDFSSLNHFFYVLLHTDSLPGANRNPQHKSSYKLSFSLSLSLIYIYSKLRKLSTRNQKFGSLPPQYPFLPKVNENLQTRGSQIFSSPAGVVPARVALALLTSAGVVMLYVLRINMSVAIVAMVKPIPLRPSPDASVPLADPTPYCLAVTDAVR